VHGSFTYLYHARLKRDRKEKIVADEREVERDVSRAEPVPGSPDPERYYAELVAPAEGEGMVSVPALQEAMNNGARSSWRLVGLMNEPGGSGVILVWDQAGFISG
jgi:hypothetical protein